MLLSSHLGDLRHSGVHIPLSLLVVEMQDAVPVFTQELIFDRNRVLGTVTRCM